MTGRDHSGEKNPFFGKRHTKETKEKTTSSSPLDDYKFVFQKVASEKTVKNALTSWKVTESTNNQVDII